METPEGVAMFSLFFKFKSYYVVWKLDGSEKYFEAKGMFKSYYVVWKH